MDIDRVFVHGGTRAPSGETACYVLGRENALLVDPAAETPAVDERLDDVAHIAVTHHHGDHVGAVATYADATDATVWCRYGKAAAFERATGVTADRTFREGSTIDTGDGPVTVLDTPGHAPEHVAFDVGDALLTGDLAVEPGSVVVGAPHGDMRAYLTSLRRVWAMNPNRLLPAHGSVIAHPRMTCERLIQHRLDRERRVLDAVDAGCHSVDEVLDAAYDKSLTGVEDLARATVRAHLVKLGHEGRIEWNDTSVTSR